MAEETSDQQRQRIEDARRAHDVHTKGVELHSKQIEVFAAASLRAPALVAAGAIFAGLGFYSANYERLMHAPEKLEAFNSMLFWLVLSLGSTVVAPCFAYMSQVCFLESLYADDLNEHRPFVTEGQRSSFWRRLGDLNRYLSIASITVSIALLCLGGWRFLALTA